MPAPNDLPFWPDVPWQSFTQAVPNERPMPWGETPAGRPVKAVVYWVCVDPDFQVERFLGAFVSPRRLRVR